MLNKLIIALINSYISLALLSPDAFAGIHADTCILADTNANRNNATSFRPQQLILPGTLIVIGALGVENGFLVKIKKNVRNGFQNLRGECRCHIDDYIQYLPAAAYLGLGFADTSPRHDFKRRFSVGLTAYAFMGIMVNVTKKLVDERRPDSFAVNSFPSGHTAMAFTGAELVRMEYPWPYGLGAYGIASLTAFMRLYNDRHWINDLLAGAGIGILSARMAYWMLPLYDKWFFSKKNKKRCGEQRIIAPCFNPYSRSVGLSAILTF